MSIVLDGTTGITTPGLTNTGTETLVNLTTTGNTTLGDASTDTLNVGNGGLVKDASGNVGVGVTPTAIQTGYKAIQIGATVGGGIVSAGTDTYFTNNLYVTGGQWYTGATGYGNFYNASNGVHAFGTTTTAGAAGAKTLTTQMTLNATGTLLLGPTASASEAWISLLNNFVTKPGMLLSGNTAGDASNSALTVAKYDNSSATTQILIRFVTNNGANGSGQINANGANSAAFGTFSDSRLKENIVDLPPQLANIMALRPVEYDYIESEGGGHQIGFIAQEVQAIYSDLVGERTDGMLTLSDMNKNDARLIKAMQEMKAIIDNQASTITTLTDRITALEAR